MKHHIDNLKNFGFRGETVVEEPGINAKLNEFQAAYGLLQLKYVDRYIVKREAITKLYKKLLKNILGIHFLSDIENITQGYSYFPIFVDEDLYGISRDALYEKLKDNNIFARRYFYPLISDFEPYRDLVSAKTENLPVATKAAKQVLCLPIFVELNEDSIIQICSIVKSN
jgi:dTDP-4-amino-4,6-dideoxygalactose transaminase